MKRSILLFTSFAFVAAITLMSNATGPASFGTGNRTGGPGSGGATCAQVGCHGGGAVTGNTIVQFQGLVDKITQVPVASGKYTPGKVYEVVMSCIYTGSLSDPDFGYQVMILNPATPNNNAGTISAMAAQPGNSVLVTVGGRSIIEHSTPADPAVPNTVAIKFDWTAPNPGIGTVHLYAAFNAVNKNTIADALDEPSAAFMTQIFQQTASVEELSQNIRITAFPNPVQDQLNLNFDGAEPGVYTISVFDLNGRTIRTEELSIHNQNARTSIAASNWASGAYMIRVMKDGAQRVITVSK